jgi:Uma2 family endonuclease
MLAIDRPMPSQKFLVQPQVWQAATWADYVALRDDATSIATRLCFDDQWLWVEMGSEGINHAVHCDLLTMLIAFWAQRHPDPALHSLGRCQLEKVDYKAAAPDLVVYVGEPIPRWEDGQRRFLDLNQARSPALVGEISDTTLATDLDEKKRLYASLGISEYWVIDVQGVRLFGFSLTAAGTYQQIQVSQVLPGLTLDLITASIQRLNQGSNTAAALWFAGQIAIAST